MLPSRLALVVTLAQLAAADLSGNASAQAHRAPRVTGRIVKLYAHARQDGFRCPAAGFHADPASCTVFYRCVESSRGKFTTFKFQCSPGTVYDPETGVCNFPSGTRRTECGGSSRLPEPSTEASNENEIDSNGPDQPPPSPISTRNPNAERIIIAKTEPTTTAAPWYTSTERITTVETKSASTNIKPIPVAQKNPTDSNGEKCTTDGFIGDSKNCKKFYRCVANGRGGFIRYEFSCSELTVWDDNIQACNHAWAARNQRCGRGEINEDKNMEISSETTKTSLPLQSQEKYGFNSSQKKTQLNYGDRIRQNQYQLNDDLNSSQPQSQENNKAVLTSQSLKQTNFGDHKTQSKTQINHSKQSSQTQTQSNKNPSDTTAQNYYGSNDQSQNDEKTTSTQSSVSAGSTEDDQCTSSGFMGDSEDCKKFYRCVDNGKGSFTKYEFSCGEGTVWDSNTDACNHAWAVEKCGGKSKRDKNKVEQTTKSGTTTPKTTTTLKSTQTTDQSTPEDIDDYDQGYGHQTQRPTEQTHGPIVTTTLEIVSPSNNKDNRCTSSGFMGDTEDCKKFYRCVDNGRGSFTRYEFTCGEGTVWDNSAEACNHEWAVKECGGKSKEDVNKPSNSDATTTQKSTTQHVTGSISEDEDSGYGQQQDETQEQQTPSITSSTTEKSNESSYEYECLSSGFMGDTNNCKTFYRCVDDGKGGYIKYEFSCGEGTVWDQSIEACNHAWAVKQCGGTQTSEHFEGGQSTLSATSETGMVTTESFMAETTSKEEDDQGYGPTRSTALSSSLTSTEKSEGAGKDQCSKEGFIGDSKDCKKFYRCVDNGRGGYIKYEFSCGEGTIWDSDIDACNHQQRPCRGSESQTESLTESQTTKSTTEQPSGITQTTQTEPTKESEATTKHEVKPSNDCNGEGFVGDEFDCKKFYRCVDNGKGGFTKYEFYCGDGTVWDQDIQACNHEAMVKNCGVGGNTSSDSTDNEIDSGYGSKPEHDEPQDEQTLTSKTTDAPSKTSTDSFKSPSSDDTCAREGFYPDSNDCKKFYRCVDNGHGGYTKYDFTCGEGTVWDQEIEACNHPTNNKQCGNASSQPNMPVQSESTTEKQQEDSSTSRQEDFTKHENETINQTTSPKPTSADKKCTSEGFHPDENDCKKFYRCVSNGNGDFTKYEFSCGEGTVWDQEIQGCNFESNSKNCGQKSQSSTTTQQPHTAQTSGQSATDHYEDEYVTPDQENQQTSKKPSSDGGSDQKCTSEGFFANESDCKKFYRCVDNGKGGYTKYDFDCGEGTAWDQEAQTCNYEDSVNCKSSNQQGGSSELPPNDEQQPEHTEKPAPESSHESTTSKDTSSENSSQENTTNKKPSSSGKCDQEGYFGNPDDCKKFYRCVADGKGGYTKYDFDCGEGTIWDQDLTTCNHPGDVKNPSCSDEETQPSTTSSSSPSSEKSTSTTTTESSFSEDNQSSSTSKSESTSKPSSSNITCPEAGFYANPDDCKKFYRCVDYEGDGKSYTVFHFDCGEGTIWDPSLDTCNYEDSIYPPRDCSKQSQSQEVQPSENQEPETTTSSSETDSTTTYKSTTQEKTTTQQTTTHKETTTQQSTTEEQTTAQQSTSQEQTTTQQTTQEQTTAQSTTQELTTQEQTTQKQTTTDKSTTQESSTGQQTTSQQTTTQETTTTESTTTQQPTSQPETTTQQQSTTTQQETTEESTTAQQTTASQQETTTNQQQTSTQDTQTETTTQSGTTETQTEEGTTEKESENQTNSSTESDDQQSTTEQSASTESSSSSEECPKTEDDQNLFVCPTGFKRHPKYCNLFYQCTEDNNNHDVKIAMFHCQNNTIYDESKTQCVEEEEADKKCDGERAERRRFKRLDDSSKPPISVGKSSLRCRSEGHFPFDKKDSCSPAFLKCQRPIGNNHMRGFIYRCPEGFVYWAVSRRCEHLKKMRECQGSDNSWKGRWEIPMETFNVAP